MRYSNGELLVGHFTCNMVGFHRLEVQQKMFLHELHERVSYVFGLLNVLEHMMDRSGDNTSPRNVFHVAFQSKSFACSCLTVRKHCAIVSVQWGQAYERVFLTVLVDIYHTYP